MSSTVFRDLLWDLSPSIKLYRKPEPRKSERSDNYIVWSPDKGDALSAEKSRFAQPLHPDSTIDSFARVLLGVRGDVMIECLPLRLTLGMMSLTARHVRLCLVEQLPAPVPANQI